MTKGQRTHQAIRQAIVRIQKDRPKIAAKGRKMSVAAVALEAGVSRATIYNNHPGLAEHIRQLENKSSRSQRDATREQLAEERNKNRALRIELSDQRIKNAKMASELATLTSENERLAAIAQSKKIAMLPAKS